MSDANENITNQSDVEPRSDAIANEPPRSVYAYEPGQFAAPPPPKSRLWLLVLLGVGSAAILALAIGLVITALAKTRVADYRTQRINNCKQMVLALNNVASCTTDGSIPPSYGAFPVGGAPQSFFVSLLPYLEGNGLYTNWASYSTMPVKTYISPADPYNPGTGSLISYGSNATLLTVGGQPTLPKSFNGRTSGVIVVFERTAKSGATWSGSNNYLFDQNGNSSPEFSGSNLWTSYGTRATALESACCVVGMGDGSARIVNQSNANAGWSWAMDPSINSGQPAGW